MKFFLPVILSCLFIFSAKSQVVNIPDANFKNALLNHNPVINTNNDGEIQVSEAVAVTGEISVDNKNIASLSGIESFVNVNSISCKKNQLTTLTLNNLPKLMSLVCDENQLNSLNLNNTPLLTYLSCQINQITSLQLSSFPQLRFLFCQSNVLTSLSLNAAAPFEFFNCDNNQLTSLVVANSSRLAILNCNYNKLTSLSVGNAPYLVNFSCTDNKLTTLSLGDAPLLPYLPCYNNELTSLTVGNLDSLRTLHCINNKLTSLPVISSRVLQNIYCTNNRLTNLSFSNHPTLQRIDCDKNNLTSITLTNLPSFSLLFAQQNQVNSVTVSNLPSVQLLDVANNQLSSLTISNLPLLSYLGVSTNPLSSLTVSNLPRLTSFLTANNIFTTLDLSQVPVKALTCRLNPNLKNIIVKNGVISNDSAFHFAFVPALQSVCADDAETVALNTALSRDLPGQNVSTSSFCNFNPNGNYNTIIGKIRFDENMNGCSNLDSNMQNVKVNINDGVQTGTTFTDAQGNYKFFVVRDTNTVTPVFENPYFTSTPPSQTKTFIGFGSTQTADFCVTPNGSHADLEITLLPLRVAIPGFDLGYYLVCKNKGNHILSGTATLNFDAVKLNFLSAIPNVTSQTAGNLIWNYSGLSPYETRTITLFFHVNAPPVVNIGDTLSFTAVINPVSGDDTPADNTFNLNQVVRGSWDPNDKDVTEGSTIDISKVGDYLHYTIRFQNIGTAEAINVIIKDSLADNLNWNSLVPVAASHAYRTVLSKGNKVEFIFENINLPGKNTNEPASHGYVSFKIKPKPLLTVGETISNKAEIYFDFNQPVITNTTITKIISPNLTRNLIALSAYPNPVEDEIRFSVKPGLKIRAVNLFNTVGERIYSETVTSPGTDRKVNIAHLPTGILFLEVITNGGVATQKIMRIK